MLRDMAINLRDMSLPWKAGLIGATLFGIVYSYTGAPYYQSLFLSMAMYVVLCSSWNVISGFGGYVSFGHVVFWGVGAYATAIAVNVLGLPWPLALVGAGIVPALFAAAVAWPLLRLDGVYFAIAMLALAEAVKVAIIYARPLTGGGGGIYLRPLIGVDDAFLMMVVLAVVVVALVVVLQQTRFIQSLNAIRNNELASESLGIPTTRVKAGALVFSAFFPGIAGGIYILNVAFIDPRTALDIGITLNIILMTVFGGIATRIGPVIGPVVFLILSETLWAQFPFIHKALLGLVIIALVLFLPRGVVPSIARYAAR